MAGSQQYEYERDIRAGVEMANFLVNLGDRRFQEYRKMGLHVIPRSAWNRLDPEMQKRCAVKGVETRADDHQTHAGAPIEDMPLADTSVALPSDQAIADDPDDQPEELSHPIMSLCADERTWYILRQMLDIIIAAPNARLEAECFRISSGLGFLDDITEASVARKHGLTRAAVSKRCVRQTKLLGMRPSQFMRSMALRQKYRNARIKSLQRQKKGVDPVR